MQSARGWFAAVLLFIVLGTFAAWYHASNGIVTGELMAEVAARSFLFVIIAHMIAILTLVTLGALSIAGEMDRKTLGFVLATRLNSAQIVLGKLAACLTGFGAIVVAGLPVSILLHVLGGLPPELILLAYGGTVSTAVFMVAVAIFVSAGTPSGRRAVNVSILCISVWLALPGLSSLTSLLGRIGLRPPGSVQVLTAWLLAPNPAALLPRFIGGPVSPRALYYTVGWMCGLQLAAALLLILAAIARLRPAFRTNVGGAAGPLGRLLAWPAWRLRARPPVGDDPIVWKEMHTNRGTLIGQLLGQCILIGLYSALAYGTLFFARRAFAEVWRHGYGGVSATDERPEFNLALRYFLKESGPGAAYDAARTDFNLFLRFITCSIMLFLSLVAVGIAVEVIGVERAKDTWNSLIATPLPAPDILLGKARSAVWRLHAILGILFVLWTLGLLSGAVHPLGYVAAVLIAAASTACWLALGFLIALKKTDRSAAGNSALGLSMIAVVYLPLLFLLPKGINSPVWGAARPRLRSGYLWFHIVRWSWRRNWGSVSRSAGSAPI